jgi:hypothetical protein
MHAQHPRLIEFDEHVFADRFDALYDRACQVRHFAEILQSQLVDCFAIEVTREDARDA